jgi:hypothetical protein
MRQYSTKSKSQLKVLKFNQTKSINYNEIDLIKRIIFNH